MCLGRDAELCVRLQSVLIWPLRGECGFLTGRRYRHAYLGLLPSPEQLLAENAFKVFSLPHSFAYFEL